MAQRGPIQGTFTATGQSQELLASDPTYNVSIWGGSGSVSVERSFDGITWLTIESFSQDVERILDNVEVDVYYRFNCTSYSSGTINYRIGARKI